uniref:Uncharacterized protein n=1 Tax=Solibacter usitatus (strain Ellin6076) TaxID=234267 RepID=Q020H8_SOLUE
MPTNPGQTAADLPATCAQRMELGCPLPLRRQKPSEDRYRLRPTITFHSHPLVRVGGAIQIDPLHFHGSIMGRYNSGTGSVLQAICEAQHFLLLRRRKAADLVQNGFFETHATSSLIIPELAEAVLSTAGTETGQAGMVPLGVASILCPPLTDRSRLALDPALEKVGIVHDRHHKHPVSREATAAALGPP